MTKRMKKTVKAWAVLLDGKLAHYDDGEKVSFAKTKKEASSYLKNDGYKIVPCEITYSI